MLVIGSSVVNNILMIVGIVIAALAFLFLVLSYIFALIRGNKYHQGIEKSSNTLRVFSIDVKNDRVFYFNRSDLRHKKNITITDFYAMFPESEREKLIHWIAELLDKDAKTNDFLEINVYDHKAHQRYFSLLQVRKIDKENQVIYLESHMLKFMSASRVRGHDINHFVTKEIFAKTITTNFLNKGVTMDVNFYSKRKNNDDVPHLIYTKIMNALTPFININRPMLAYDNHQIIIADSKAITKQKTIQLVNTIKNEINRFLVLNAYEEEIGYTIGVVESKYFTDDFEGLLENAIKISKIAREDDEEILYYEEGYNFDESRDAQHYRTEVEKIIQDKKLKYFFQPIYDSEHEFLVGYQSSVVPVDSFFETIDELKKYSVRTEDDRELFATIARNTITRFIEEKDDISLKLFFPISPHEIDYVNKTLSYISHIKDTNIVLVIDEAELNGIDGGNAEGFINSIRVLKSKGYQTALEIEDSELTMSDSIYNLFDFFMISTSSHISKKSASRQLPTFQGLIEKLLKYHKDIIAIDIPSWDVCELVIRFGVYIVGGDVIAPKDENVLPLNKKAVTKLNSIS